MYGITEGIYGLLFAFACACALSIWQAIMGYPQSADKIDTGDGCSLSFWLAIAVIANISFGGCFGLMGFVSIISWAGKEAQMLWEVAIRFIVSGLLFLLVGWLIDRGRWYLSLETASVAAYITGVLLIVSGLLIGIATVITL